MMGCTEQDILGQAFEDAFEVLQEHSSMQQYMPEYKSYLTFINHHSHVRANTNLCAVPPLEAPLCNWRDLTTVDAEFHLEGNIHHMLQNVPESQLMHSVQTTAVQQKDGKGRKKLRLFEYLHESLHDPNMTNCIQWVDKPNGIFQFISKNKEKLAELWGKRKGNRKLMTYQKMARALRNYGRTGEIMKIRRKLTYQFSAVILQRLSPMHFFGKETMCYQYVPPGPDYCNSDNWNINYNFMYNNELDQNLIN